MAKINANYEAVYILQPDLSEEQIAALVAKFKAVVEANGTVSGLSHQRSDGGLLRPDDLYCRRRYPR